MKTFNVHILFILVLLIGVIHEIDAQHFPFPQHVNYATGHIKPTNYSQDQLDHEVKAFYDYWKINYVDPYCGNGRYFVKFAPQENVSEGLGYGMMIVAYMAGYDSEAKIIFDGMYHFYKDYPSQVNPRLMAWKQRNCASVEGPNSATDGDLDIAFSLLLAHAQWNSNGDIDYLAEAKHMINAIYEDDINHEVQSIKLGDWVNSSEPHRYYATRSSDLMTSHLRSFGQVEHHHKWKRIADTTYALIELMQNTFSPTTGLVPDFIVHINTDPEPAPPNYLERPQDGDYYYNACRFPWRVGTDFLLFGDDRAQAAVNKIITWLKTACNNDPNLISSGYKLDGTKLHDWNDVAFIGPFTIGAMLNEDHQDFLNILYDKLLSFGNPGDYYHSTIKMCNLLVISGNTWAPDSTLYYSGISQFNYSNQLFHITSSVVRDQLTIVKEISGTIANVNFTILNLSGNTVFSMSRSDQNRYTIDVSGIPPGIYCLTISIPGGHSFGSHKFIKIN